MSTVIILICVVMFVLGLWLLWRTANNASSNGVEFQPNEEAYTDSAGLSTSPIVISLDVKTTSNSGTIVVFSNSAVVYNKIFLTLDGGKLMVNVVTSTLPVPTNYQIATTTKINDGVFHTIKILVTPTKCTAFIDGWMDGEAALTGTVTVDEPQFGGNEFAGYIRNVKFGNVDKILTRQLK